jgi:predicted HicB family RNase H-like nuclease
MIKTTKTKRVYTGRKRKTEEEKKARIVERLSSYTNLRIPKDISKELSKKAKRKGISKIELLRQFAFNKYF